MASGFKVRVNGADIDLDDWFDPYVQGTKPALTGYTVNGQDLRDRYAPLVYGTKAALTSYNVTGVGDLRELFAAKGTAVYSHVIANPGWLLLSSTLALQGQPGTVQSSASVTLNPDGSWTKQSGTSSNPGVPRTGAWFDPTGAGAGSPYQVRFTLSVTENDGAVIANDAPDWTGLSSARAWGATVSGPGNAGGSKWLRGTLRIQIRRASDGVVLSDQYVSVTVGLQKA